MNIEIAKGEQVFDMKIYYGGQVLDVKLASFNIIKGEDGFSPIVETERTEDGHKVTITDKNGEKSFEVLDGKNGVNGKTPYIQDGYWYIGGVSTGIKAEGKDGYTPQKGIDYYTPEEQEAFDAAIFPKAQIHNVAELPQTLNERSNYDLWRVSKFEGCYVRNENGEVVEIPQYAVFAHFVDELPEVGKPTIGGDRPDSELPSETHIYASLSSGLCYIYREGIGWMDYGNIAEISTVVFFSKEAFLESGLEAAVLVKPETKIYALDGQSVKSLADPTLPPSYVELISRNEFEETLKTAANQINGELETKEEKLELWNDITLTEDVERLDFTKKDNGELYQGFRKMYVAIYGKITEGLSTRLRGGVTETGGNQSFLWGATVTYSYKTDTQYACWFAEFERVSNNAYRSEAASSFFRNESADSAMQTNQVSLYNRKQPLDYYFNPTGFYLTIEKRDTTQEGTPCFLAGTNIKVWGIK